MDTATGTNDVEAPRQQAPIAGRSHSARLGQIGPGTASPLTAFLYVYRLLSSTAISPSFLLLSLVSSVVLSTNKGLIPYASYEPLHV